MKKRGRPKKTDGRRDHAVKIRLNESEKNMLDNICEELGVTYADFLRQSLRYYTIVALKKR